MDNHQMRKGRLRPSKDSLTNLIVRITVTLTVIRLLAKLQAILHKLSQKRANTRLYA